MRPLRVVPLLALGACSALQIPPAETPYFRQQADLAQAAPAAAPRGAEAAVLREAAAELAVRATAEAERIRRGDETEGLLDAQSPAAREFLALLADPARAEEVLATTPLDLEHVLLAVHARNPGVAAARANWAATVRMYEQATYLEDLLLRSAAFTRLAAPRIGAAPMREAAFPYPGLVALKGEMIDREVTMAREMARMRLRDAMVAAARAYHEATHHEQELAIRVELLSLADRVVAATRKRVEAGKGPQAELLEMEAERAMAENDRAHAVTSLARARRELNTLLARSPGAPIALRQHGDPPAQTPALAPFLELAARFSPQARVARAETGRSAAAIRMSEAMLFAAPAPGASVAATPMDGSVPVGPDASGAAAPGMAGAMDAAPGTAPHAPGLPPRDGAPGGAPVAFGADLAWVAELRERHVALGRAAEEAALAVQREVVRAHYELDAARRMFEVAARSTEPLSAQSVEERIHLYEAGRGDFAELTAALQLHLRAAHDVAAARHEYGMAQAMLWMAAGARPEAVGDASEGGER